MFNNFSFYLPFIHFQRSRISILLVSHLLSGDLHLIKPLKLPDLNLCPNSAKHIHFGKNIMENCRLNLRMLIDRGEKQPWFMNLYLNYTENNENFLKSIPILIRNSIVQNTVSIEME